MTLKITVTGMSCDHCRHTVESAVKNIPGVEGVVVDLRTGELRVTGNVPRESVIEAVRSAGYDITEV
jgi:copper chaperone CopZ